MTIPPAKNGFAKLGIVMVTATIVLAGFVAFRFLNAQDNTEIADTSKNTPQSSQVASIKSVEDVNTVTEELDTTELDTLDAQLDAEFAF